MKHKVDNAIILSAGFSNRFVPLSLEKPKALLTVRGEVLIERQITQLIEKGINEIYVVVGYKSEKFEYLKSKYNVKLIYNNEYKRKNNISSIYAVKSILKNSYICSSDNYFTKNPFHKYEDNSFYSVLYSNGRTNEWCVKCDLDGTIMSVSIGGENSYYMCGHAFLDNEFSNKYVELLENEYNHSNTSNYFWEDIYINHIDLLKLKIKKMNNTVYEFDSLEDLRKFDNSYINNTRCSIIESLAEDLGCEQRDLHIINPIINDDNRVIGFKYSFNDEYYDYFL